MPKGSPLTDEQKERMAAGRKLAASRKEAERAAQSAMDPAEAVAVSGGTVPPAPALGDFVPTSALQTTPPEPDVGTNALHAARQRLLGDLDPETSALITDEELAKMLDEERSAAILEQKKQTVADVRARIKQEARAEHNLIPASQLRSEAERKRLNEKLEIRFNLPGEGSGHRGSNGFRIDGALLQVNQWTPCTRAQYESILSNHWRAHKNEVEFKTLDQDKPNGSAGHIMDRNPPMIEVREAHRAA